MNRDPDPTSWESDGELNPRGCQLVLGLSLVCWVAILWLLHRYWPF